MKPLIRKLVEAYGPSGHEEHVREMIRAEIKGLADYVSVDPLGNLIAVIKKKSKSGKKVMLAAHMDEIGVMVTHIDSKGFVRIVPVGGVFLNTLVGGRVRFGNGAVGVVNAEDRRGNPASFDQVYVDVGATSADDCPVKVGDAAGFYRPYEELGGRLKVPLAATALVQQLYRGLEASGEGELGTQALILALNRLGGFKRETSS